MAPEDSGVFSVALNRTETFAQNPGEGRAIVARMIGFRSNPIIVELRIQKGSAAHFFLAEQSGFPDTEAGRSLAAARGPSTMPAVTAQLWSNESRSRRSRRKCPIQCPSVRELGVWMLASLPPLSLIPAAPS